MTNFEAMSVSDLLNVRQELDQILERRTVELEQQLAAIRNGKALATRKPQTQSKPAKNINATKKSSNRARVMYKHPKTGDVWSGRGMTAKWLAREIAAGKSKEDFRV